MRRNLVVAGVSACLFALLAAPAAAQGGDATRPGGSTFLGDTGLWFVPTAEILAGGSVAASGQLVNLNREQGFSNIEHVVGTFAVGVGGGVVAFLEALAVDPDAVDADALGPADVRVEVVADVPGVVRR